MAVFYIFDEDLGWGVHTAYAGGTFFFYNPSECWMFVPGTYDEMMKDYG